jgi:hypothetical protein
MTMPAAFDPIREYQNDQPSSSLLGRCVVGLSTTNQEP